MEALHRQTLGAVDLIGAYFFVQGMMHIETQLRDRNGEYLFAALDVGNAHDFSLVTAAEYIAGLDALLVADRKHALRRQGGQGMLGHEGKNRQRLLELRDQIFGTELLVLHFFPAPAPCMGCLLQAMIPSLGKWLNFTKQTKTRKT